MQSLSKAEKHISHVFIVLRSFSRLFFAGPDCEMVRRYRDLDVIYVWIFNIPIFFYVRTSLCEAGNNFESDKKGRKLKC